MALALLTPGSCVALRRMRARGSMAQVRLQPSLPAVEQFGNCACSCMLSQTGGAGGVHHACCFECCSWLCYSFCVQPRQMVLLQFSHAHYNRGCVTRRQHALCAHRVYGSGQQARDAAPHLNASISHSTGERVRHAGLRCRSRSVLLHSPPAETAPPACLNAPSLVICGRAYWQPPSSEKLSRQWLQRPCVHA